MPSPRKPKPNVQKPRTRQQARDYIVGWVKGVAGLIGALAIILGAFVAFDSRYALAADIKEQLEINRLTAEISVMQIRRSNLEDKVYDQAARQAASRQRLNAAESASFERYKAELNAVASEITDKQKLLDRIRSGK